MVDKSVGFEVVFKTAEVHVSGATRAECVVAHEDFGVEKGTRVKIHFHTSLKYLGHIGAACPLYQFGITVAGNHQAHVNSGKCSGAHGEENRLSG